jgi:hypothetical protein
MVMGAIGGWVGSGSQGPMGPPGPPGPPGPVGDSWADPFTSPLGVHVRSGVMPFPMQPLAWIRVPWNFVLFQSQAGLLDPDGRFVAPVKGYYLLTALVMIREGQGGFALRVVGDGMAVQTELVTTTNTLQISTQTFLDPGQHLHVEIKAPGPLPIELADGPTRCQLTVNGIGVAP